MEDNIFIQKDVVMQIRFAILKSKHFYINLKKIS